MYTPSVPRKMTSFLGGTEFYATLFCLLNGESKVRERGQSRDKGVSILSNGSSWLGQTKKKSGSSLIGRREYLNCTCAIQQNLKPKVTFARFCFSFFLAEKAKTTYIIINSNLQFTLRKRQLSFLQKNNYTLCHVKKKPL